MPHVASKFLLSLLLRPSTASLAKGILRLRDAKLVTVAVPQRIGHLALETDCFLRDAILKAGRVPLAIMVEPTQGGFANPVLAEYLSRYVLIVPRIQRGDLIEKALTHAGFAIHTAPYAVAMYETAKSYDVFRRWSRRKPLFTLTPQDRTVTREALRAMGVPEGAWFVCVHARTGGYSPADEHWHAHRNVDIADYEPAMDLITARGGWCIRMGDATMSPMPPRERTVDYALSPLKSARLDIGLTASCRFFLGCASGLYNVAAMFGRPSVLANVTPLSGAYALGLEDLAIPQKVLDADGCMMPFDATFDSDVANFRLAEEFEGRDLRPTNVHPNEIAELTAEMMDRLEGTAIYTADDERRQDIFRGYLRPGHYAHGAGSRIGREFLRSYLPLN